MEEKIVVVLNEMSEYFIHSTDEKTSGSYYPNIYRK